MTHVIKAPRAFKDAGAPKLFLAGSIEMGSATDWRATVVEALASDDITFLDPWRDDWDASWKQEIGDEQFRTQVEWELDALEAADAILMCFEPGTFAPISLLEFGLFAGLGNMVVCCPEGFWRKGNVDIVCKRYGIPITESLEEAVWALQAMLGAKGEEEEE